MRLSRIRLTAYWKSQLFGWGFYALSGVAFGLIFGQFAFKGALLSLLVGALGLGLTHVYRGVIRRRGWTSLSLGRVAIRAVGCSVLIASIMVVIVFPLMAGVLPPGMGPGVFLVNLFNWSATVLIWSLIYFGYHAFKRVQAAESEKWQLELAMREQELSTLRMQLNPHFLFNSLNSLRGLIVEDPARAQEAVTRLAAMLRYTLQLSRSQRVALRDELEATRHYLELERIRFEERLDFELDAEDGALGALVPPLLVQTLAENAVKHGIARLPAGGQVRVSARRPDGELLVRVENTGRLDPVAGDGIGLRNSLERLRLLFGDGVRLELREEPPGTVVAEVAIPATRAPAPDGPAADPAALDVVAADPAPLDIVPAAD